jgi:hypothetical protein
MLARWPRYLLPFIGSIVAILFLIFSLYGQSPAILPSIKNPSSEGSTVKNPSSQDSTVHNPSSDGSSGKSQTPETPPKHIGHPIGGYTEGAYHEIFSVSTADKKYFKIKFHEHSGINPNAIPHPNLENTWVIVAQLNDRHSLWESVWFAELVCNAAFKGENLECIKPPFILPIGKTPVRAYLLDKDSETYSPPGWRAMYGRAIVLAKDIRSS